MEQIKEFRDLRDQFKKQIIEQLSKDFSETQRPLGYWGMKFKVFVGSDKGLLTAKTKMNIED